MIGTTEIIVIAFVILLLFGGTQIPKLMKGIGKGVRSYKEGINGINEDEKKDESRASADAKAESVKPEDESRKQKAD